MQLYPVIYISDGKSVDSKGRLYEKDLFIELDPVKLALYWQAMGAKYLQVIDLDAAIMGFPVNEDTVERIVHSIDIPVQYGGGIRTKKDIDTFINMGIQRIIIGTQAIEDPHFIQEAIEVFGNDRIIVAMDVSHGMVAIKGRAKISNYNVLVHAQRVEQQGIKTIIYTDIQGPDHENIVEIIKRTDLNIIYSGDIMSLKNLMFLDRLGMQGIILDAKLYKCIINSKESMTLLK